MAQFFGYEFKRKSDKEEVSSFAPPANNDGEIINENGIYGAFNAFSMQLGQDDITDENAIIKKCREISTTSDVDQAISEIVSEAIVFDPGSKVAQLAFSETFDELYNEKLKNILKEEFEHVYKLFDMSNKAQDHFKTWYVDGRLCFHAMIDQASPKDGIKEIRQIDSLNIKKVVEVKKQKSKENGSVGVTLYTDKDEYFVYSDKGFAGKDNIEGLRISKDAIIWSTSGIREGVTHKPLSFLYKAIRPANQLRMVEEAFLIYTVTRAPERRVFYIDTNGMSRTRGEQYIREIMNRYRNKPVYDSKTGALKEENRHSTMLEDFWLPRNGTKGTEVQTLPGGTALSNTDLLDYFKNKMYTALNVPLGRLQPNQAFSLGRSNEISRDEVRFSHFITKLRARFAKCYIEALGKNLILKGLISSDEWEPLAQTISIEFNKDNFFAEIKEAEVLRERLTTLQQAEPFIGKYFSDEYVFKNILRMKQDEIDAIVKQIPTQTEPADDQQSA